MDFTICSSNQLLLALTPQPAAIDTGLFMRPFTRISWQYTLIMFFVLLAVLILPYGIFDFYERTESFMIVRYERE